MQLINEIILSFGVDINECENNTGGCEQNCTNTIGSFYCNCSEGFSLINGFVCEGM